MPPAWAHRRSAVCVARQRPTVGVVFPHIDSHRESHLQRPQKPHSLPPVSVLLQAILVWSQVSSDRRRVSLTCSHVMMPKEPSLDLNRPSRLATALASRSQQLGPKPTALGREVSEQGQAVALRVTCQGRLTASSAGSVEELQSGHWLPQR